MNIVFYSTNDVFKAEELLLNNKIECKIVPTPVQDKAYCGVCLETHDNNALSCIKDYEYEIINGKDE